MKNSVNGGQLLRTYQFSALYLLLHLICQYFSIRISTVFYILTEYLALLHSYYGAHGARVRVLWPVLLLGSNVTGV